MVSWEPWAPVPVTLRHRAPGRAAARLPQHRPRARRAGPLHPALRTQPGALPRDGRPALRARDERLLVPVEPQPARLRLRLAADRPHLRRRGRAQRALRVVGEPEPLREPAGLAPRPARVLAGPPLRRRRRVDDDRLRRREVLPRPPLRAAPAVAAPHVPQADRADRDQHRLRGSRARGCTDLRAMLRRTPWIETVAWSQLPSRGKAHQRGTGVVDWDVRSDAGERRRCSRGSSATAAENDRSRTVQTVARPRGCVPGYRRVASHGERGRS